LATGWRVAAARKADSYAQVFSGDVEPNRDA
jgi:hypothetical protein